MSSATIVGGRAPTAARSAVASTSIRIWSTRRRWLTRVTAQPMPTAAGTPANATGAVSNATSESRPLEPDGNGSAGGDRLCPVIADVGHQDDGRTGVTGVDDCGPDLSHALESGGSVGRTHATGNGRDHAAATHRDQRAVLRLADVQAVASGKPTLELLRRVVSRQAAAVSGRDGAGPEQPISNRTLTAIGGSLALRRNLVLGQRSRQRGGRNGQFGGDIVEHFDGHEVAGDLGPADRGLVGRELDGPAQHRLDRSGLDQHRQSLPERAGS